MWVGGGTRACVFVCVCLCIWIPGGGVEGTIIAKGSTTPCVGLLISVVVATAAAAANVPVADAVGVEGGARLSNTSNGLSSTLACCC